MNPIALPQMAKLFWYTAHLIEQDMHAVKGQCETMVLSATASPWTLAQPVAGADKCIYKVT